MAQLKTLTVAIERHTGPEFGVRALSQKLAEVCRRILKFCCMLNMPAPAHTSSPQRSLQDARNLDDQNEDLCSLKRFFAVS